jgi:transcriptional regulator with XRE-family HTH domain
MRPRELKRIRERLKMSQEEMAGALGLKHKSQVHYMETGRFKIAGPAEAAIRQLAESRPLGDVPSYRPVDVRRIRQALGLTQVQMAKALGLQYHSQVAHLESGRSRVNWSKAILLQQLEAKIPKKKR